MQYNIKKNNYTESVEYQESKVVRKEVVQMLCDFYTKQLSTCWNEFVANRCWRQSHSIGYDNNGKLSIIDNCTQCPWNFKDAKRIRTCEMKEFFKVWLDAGYYISKGTSCVKGQTAIIYRFTAKPFTDYGYKIVTEFAENID